MAGSEVKLDDKMEKQELSPEERWTVVECEDNGKRLIFRIRNTRPHGIEPNTYPHLIAISWIYQSNNEFGWVSLSLYPTYDLFTI